MTTKTGKLDDDAAARMDALLEVCAANGCAQTPGELMSRAIRVYHAIACGAAELVPSEVLAEPADTPAEARAH